MSDRRSRASPKSNKDKAVKLLKSWGLHISGQTRNDDPEEFLEQLEDCRANAGATETDLFSALPCVLSKLSEMV